MADADDASVDDTRKLKRPILYMGNSSPRPIEDPHRTTATVFEPIVGSVTTPVRATVSHAWRTRRISFNQSTRVRPGVMAAAAFCYDAGGTCPRPDPLPSPIP